MTLKTRLIELMDSDSKSIIIELMESDKFYIFINIARIITLIGIVTLLFLFVIYHEEIMNATAPCSMCMNKGYNCYEKTGPALGLDELDNITIKSGP